MLAYEWGREQGRQWKSIREDGAAHALRGTMNREQALAILREPTAGTMVLLLRALPCTCGTMATDAPWGHGNPLCPESLYLELTMGRLLEPHIFAATYEPAEEDA